MRGWTYVVENLGARSFPRKVEVSHHVDPRRPGLLGLPRLDKTSIFCNDTYAGYSRSDLVEDTLDRQSAQQPNFVPRVTSKAFEQRKNLLLRLERREETCSGHVTDPNGAFEVE